MSEDNDKTKETLELVDIDVTKMSVNHIRDLFDTYCKEGKYNLDEVQKIIISINNINRSIETLNKLQIIAIKLKQNYEKKEQVEKKQTNDDNSNNINVAHNMQVTNDTPITNDASVTNDRLNNTPSADNNTIQQND